MSVSHGCKGQTSCKSKACSETHIKGCLSEESHARWYWQFWRRRRWRWWRRRRRGSSRGYRVSLLPTARNAKLTSYLPLTIKSWKDVALSEALISAITNDPMIKQALFPSPGSNVSGSKGGGKPKTDFHWQLCQILFTDHEVYRLALHKAEECTIVKKRAAWKRTWVIKIKNRLKK